MCATEISGAGEERRRSCSLRWVGSARWTVPCHGQPTWTARNGSTIRTNEANCAGVDCEGGTTPPDLQQVRLQPSTDRPMDFRTLTIGRSAAADIQVRHETVSRLHAELTVTRAGRCYLTDCGSLRGTSVYRRGVWAPHRQGYVDLNERVRFGTFETQLDGLLRGSSGGAASNREREGADSSRPKRDIETGRAHSRRVNAE